MAAEEKITTRAINPNAGLEAQYRRKLRAFVRAMRKSVVYWLAAEYKRQEPRIVMDASPTAELKKRLDRLSRQWRKNLNTLPDEVARWFVANNVKYSETALMAALKDVGFTVQIKNTAHVNTVTRAAMQENVSLIKSIGEEYLRKVESSVMRAVMAGRDLKSLVDDLSQLGQVSERRAVLIARDQTRKAMNAMTRARYEELGITRAIWRHNAGGSKSYRESHVDMDGHEFDLTKGMYDPAAGTYVQPGELVNCKCTYRAVLSEFGRAGK